ncbi:MAG: dethiobiotin synthase [Betaproteobacteria bacterium]
MTEKSAAARGYFITGTDTGVGKTLVACALLHAFARAGRRVVGMKPVAAGASRSAEGLINDDVAQLRAASTVGCELERVNPYCFEPAIAPHIAAAQAGVTIDLNQIVRAHALLAVQADRVIVEGVGGFCVPLNRHEDSADLAQVLGLPVILVVGVRLGCLSHAVLTAQAVRARGLRLAGWIANRIHPAMPAARENIAALAERLAAPLLGVVEFMTAPDPRQAAAGFNLSQLG